MPKQTYEVTSTTGYAGHKEGEVFEAELTPEQEKRAIDRGSIKQTTKKLKEEKK